MYTAIVSRESESEGNGLPSRLDFTLLDMDYFQINLMIAQ